ncbi:MAG: nucleotide-binding universal stress UspA family protein [Planctomycetota bacterium]|jgi:nucleotide-binding universal stress UspA family protein
MNVKHILLTTDLSPESLHPCKPVGDLARTVGAQITLLHVLEETRMAPHGASLAPPVTPLFSEEHEKHAELVLEEQCAYLGADVDVTTRVLRANDIATAVADYAHENEVDLICLSTHGRTGFRHLVLGSVAEAIIRRSKVPTLSFPQPK